MSEPKMIVCFVCPKCGWRYRTEHPISQLDCLGCEARVITEERPKAVLTVIKPPSREGGQ